MIHTVTITHQVEADSWDLAVEKVLRQPLGHLVKATVKTPGVRLCHLAPGSLHLAAAQLKEEDERR